ICPGGASPQTSGPPRFALRAHCRFCSNVAAIDWSRVMTVKTKPKAQAKVRAQAKAKVKTKARRRPARKEPSRIALATAYTRGYARALSKEFPKSTGFAAGAATM